MSKKCVRICLIYGVYLSRLPYALTAARTLSPLSPLTPGGGAVGEAGAVRVAAARGEAGVGAAATPTAPAPPRRRHPLWGGETGERVRAGVRG